MNRVVEPGRPVTDLGGRSLAAWHGLGSSGRMSGLMGLD